MALSRFIPGMRTKCTIGWLLTLLGLFAFAPSTSRAGARSVFRLCHLRCRAHADTDSSLRAWAANLTRLEALKKAADVAAGGAGGVSEVRSPAAAAGIEVEDFEFSSVR
jgi:hypothetical protein